MRKRYSKAMLRAWRDRQAQYWELICTGMPSRTLRFADLIIEACEHLEVLQRIAHHNGAPILTLEQWWEERFGKTLQQTANEI